MRRVYGEAKGMTVATIDRGINDSRRTTMNAVPLDEAELETLRKGARGAGLLVALSDRGFFDTFKEAGALAKHLTEARKASDSPIIREVAEGAGTKFGMTDSPDEIEKETVEALREVPGSSGRRRRRPSTSTGVSSSTSRAGSRPPRAAATRRRRLRSRRSRRRSPRPPKQQTVT